MIHNTATQILLASSPPQLQILPILVSRMGWPSLCLAVVVMRCFDFSKSGGTGCLRTSIPIYLSHDGASPLERVGSTLCTDSNTMATEDYSICVESGEGAYVSFYLFRASVCNW